MRYDWLFLHLRCVHLDEELTCGHSLPSWLTIPLGFRENFCLFPPDLALHRTSGKGNNDSSLGIKQGFHRGRLSAPREALWSLGLQAWPRMSPGIASLHAQALTSRCFLQRGAHSWIANMTPTASCTSEVKARG